MIGVLGCWYSLLVSTRPDEAAKAHHPIKAAAGASRGEREM